MVYADIVRDWVNLIWYRQLYNALDKGASCYFLCRKHAYLPKVDMAALMRKRNVPSALLNRIACREPPLRSDRNQ